jgi:glycosyltransferase involved in cell wall biosynthesis
MSFKPKIAILHAFFKADCKGGGEKLVFELRDYYKADLWAGAVDTKGWSKDLVQTDSFVAALWDKNYSFNYLHKDAQNPWWSRIQRQLYFLFSSKINELKNYDLVIFSGNIGFVPFRLVNSKVKKIMYCHTPPRPITDQLESKLSKSSKFLQPIFRLFAKILVAGYRFEAKTMDIIITNSTNTQNRLKKYIGLESKIIYPPVNTNRFKYINQKDFYLSYGRLETIKRIPLIVEAFAKMPDKKLIICSSGPLKNWLIEEIKTRNLTNVTYEGIVEDKRLEELVGNCISGIYIPVDEDAGMTQCELMSAGKPVIGVADGGLLETIIDQKTGILMPKNPTVEDLILAIQKMSPEKALSMKQDCINQAQNFSSNIFFKKMDKVVEELFVK